MNWLSMPLMSISPQWKDHLAVPIPISQLGKHMAILIPISLQWGKSLAISTKVSQWGKDMSINIPIRVHHHQHLAMSIPMGLQWYKQWLLVEWIQILRKKRTTKVISELWSPSDLVLLRCLFYPSVIYM